jgi:chromosome segregation ATPase
MSKILIGIILIMGLGGYLYYKDTQKRMAILIENNAQLEIAVATNEQAIASLQADYAAAQAENQRINAEYAEIRRQNNRLSSRLSEIDLGLIAAEKPDSIERAVNRGTVNAGRCFEILSGSPLTETELNATDGESFNKECPWLWPGPNTGGVQQPAAPAN